MRPTSEFGTDTDIHRHTDAPSASVPMCGRRSPLWLVISAVALLGVGCADEGTHTTVSRNDSGTSDIDVGIPPPILSARMVDVNNLRVEASIGGTPITMNRNGNQWRGNFGLPGDGSFELTATWFEAVQGRDLQLAAINPVQISTTSERNIVIAADDYNTLFDFDGDQISNLLERKNGFDPFVAEALMPAPGQGQGDCRPSTESAVALSNLFPDIFNVSASDNASVNVTNTVLGNRFYYDAYWVRVAGTLTITHTMGEPSSTVGTLYDADSQGNIRLLAQNNIANGGSQRGIVQQSVSPGIYCYELGAVDGFPALQNVVILSDFVAD